MRNISLAVVLMMLAAPQDSRAQPESLERSPSVDVGYGFCIGYPVGGKMRLLNTFGSGVILGMDVDVGTILIWNSVSAGAVAGYSFGTEQIVRPFVVAGVGEAYHLYGDLAGMKLDWFVHAGVGLEWKPSHSFGFGVEGGVEAIGFHVDPHSNPSHWIDANSALPFVRFSFIFYR